MKVVLLKQRLDGRGGLEKSALQIGAAFCDRGAEVTLLTANAPLSLPFVTHTFPLPKWPPSLRLERFDLQVQKWLKKQKVDLVFGLDRNRFQTHLRAGNGVHAAWLEERRKIEGDWKYRLCKINPLHRKILELEKTGFEHPGLRTLFVNSEMVKKEILSFYNVEEKKIQVVHNGVEWKQWQAPFDAWQEGKKRALHQFGLQEGDLHLLFVGNGFRRKGLDLLLEAMALWKKKEVHLSVVGKDRKIEFYRKKVFQLKLQGRVDFFGLQTDLLPFYQMADLLLIPSFYDPFANVTVEALAMGLFVISSKRNGGREVLNEGNGSLIESLQDKEALIACLNRAFPKTLQSAERIRHQIAHLDYSNQLQRIMDLC